LKKTFTGHTKRDFAIVLLHHVDLASGSADKTKKNWNSSTWELMRTLTGHSGGVLSLSVLDNILLFIYIIFN
jgi:WD40 repeat protein